MIPLRGPRSILAATRSRPRRRTWRWALCRLLGGSPDERRLIRYRLAEVLARRIAGAWLPEDLKVWLQDTPFWARLRRFDAVNCRSAERKFAVQQLVQSLHDIPGDTVECGVYRGATSAFICRARGHGTHHVFDSFQGLSSPTPEDVPASAEARAWEGGELAATEDEVRENLAEFSFVRFYPGWIPARFAAVADLRFCFVHLDVDLYQPTRDSLEFFYPRLNPGGMLVCDDYGFANCRGAQLACDQFAASIPERLIHLPTGQGLIIKR